MVDLINGLGGDEGFGEFSVTTGDNTSVAVNLTNNNFFGNQLKIGDGLFSQVKVSTNGYISFGSLSDGTIVPGADSLADTFGSVPFIAPFFANADTTSPDVLFDPTPGGTSQGSNEVFIDITSNTLTVTWDDVGFSDGVPGTGNVSALNAFQVIITDRSDEAGFQLGDFDIEIRYEDINWAAGTNPGDVTARAAIWSGNEADGFIELPGSGTEAGVLALDETLGNTNEPGRFFFEVRDGVISQVQFLPTLSVNADALSVAEGAGGTTDVTFTLTRSDSNGALNVPFTIDGSGGNPANSDDVQGDLPFSGTATFADGALTTTVTIQVSGDVDIEADEDLTITLDPQNTLTDVVTITAQTATTTVTNDDDGSNQAPVAAADAFAINEDGGQVAGSVLADNGNGPDFDVENDVPLTTTVATDVSNGTLVLNANGTFTYTPDANFEGVDTFTYTLTDSQGESSVGTVTITVNPTNDAPVAADDDFIVVEDTPLNGNLLADNGNGLDSDLDGDALTTALAVAPANGVVQINGDGSFTYTPNANFTGNDTFTYSLSDGTLLDTGIVTVQVTPVDEAPLAQDDVLLTEEDTILTGSLFADNGNGVDEDPDGSAISVTLLNGNALNAGVGQIVLSGGGILTVNADGSFTFDPNEAYNGLTDGQTALETFTYQIQDSDGGGFDTATVQLTIEGEDTELNIAADQVSLSEDDFGDQTFTFTVTRSGDTSETATVDFALTGSGDNPANAADFLGGLISNTLTFNPGETTKTVAVVVDGDFVPETDETFTVSLSNPTVTGIQPITIGTASASSTILNDDAAFTEILDGDKGRSKGTSGDDVIQGTEGGRNKLDGDIGDDVLFGGGDRDKLRGREGDDDLIGGNDRDKLRGDEGNDALVGDGGEDRLRGGDGNDDLDGGDGDDRLDGDDGDDEIFGGDGADRARGDDGNDVIFGGAGDDDLRGDRGNDQLFGNEGNDELDGGRGDDMLYGSAGSNVLEGGRDSDTFIFSDGNGVNTIDDFDSEEDFIDLSGLSTLNDFQSVVANAVEDGKDLVVTASGGEVIIFEKTDLDDLSAGNFIF